MKLNDLKKEIAYKWRVQSYSKNKPQATIVAYIDARDVMDLLDEVVGAENWQTQYQVVNNNLMCGIGIKCGEKSGDEFLPTTREWVWKWDTGTKSEVEEEKGQTSDAFKRSAVNWGVGRFLYKLKIQYLKANVKKSQGVYPHCVDDNGNRIWDMSEHMSKARKRQPKQSSPVSKPTPKPQVDPKQSAMDKLGTTVKKDTLTPKQSLIASMKKMLTDSSDGYAELKMKKILALITKTEKEPGVTSFRTMTDTQIERAMDNLTDMFGDPPVITDDFPL